MVREFQVAGASAAIVGGSVMDIDGMERVGLPVYVTGVVPAYDDLRMAAWGEAVMVGSLRVATGDFLVGDRAGLVRIRSMRSRPSCVACPGSSGWSNRCKRCSRGPV